MPHFKDWISGFRAEYAYGDAEQFFSEVIGAYRRTDFTDFVGPGVARIVFRGTGNAEHRLMPRVFRDPGSLSDFQYWSAPSAPTSSSKEDVGSFLFYNRHNEIQAVFNFLNNTDRIGIPTPLDHYALDMEFRAALKEADDGTIDPFSWTPNNQPFPGAEVREAFAMAQHYGVPTRLLDWTESPLIAMFFAVESVWKNITGPAACHSAERICVYAIGRPLVKKIGLELIRATRFQNPRLRAQQGLFLLDTGADTFYYEHKRWPSIEDRVDQLAVQFCAHRGIHESALVKYTLDASEVRELAAILARISHSQ